ncbi:MAG: hypothetical protein ACLFV2_05360 [Desulfurivibrionaceae bacterium]
MTEKHTSYILLPLIIISYALSIFIAASPCSAAEETDIPASTSDHSKFKALKKDFKSGREVTKACLTCHNEASAQVHETIHWSWQWGEDLGKKGAQNNF